MDKNILIFDLHYPGFLPLMRSLADQRIQPDHDPFLPDQGDGRGAAWVTAVGRNSFLPRSGPAPKEKRFALSMSCQEVWN